MLPTWENAVPADHAINDKGETEARTHLAGMYEEERALENPTQG